MNRRHFLQTAGIVSAGFAFPEVGRLFAAGTTYGDWRTFEVTTRIEVLKPSGVTRIWAPGALITETPFQKTLANTFQAAGGSAKATQNKTDGMEIISAEFPAGVKPVLIVTSRVQTRDLAVDIAGKGAAAKKNKTELDYCLRPTKLLPTDGIVKQTAIEITKSAKTDVDKARAIYEWIVENTERNPKTPGCGLGDIRFMLETKDLTGKCADLNALYVGLARSVGVPARDVYGIRVASSKLGYKSLGTATGSVTKAQHCRAEVFLNAYGWVPVDPADVRKVMLEEPPGNRPINDDMVKKARARLFGSWEMNWMAFNTAHDVALPGSSGPPVGYLMYPQAETANGRLDQFDPDNFKYEITAKESAPAMG